MRLEFFIWFNLLVVSFKKPKSWLMKSIFWIFSIYWDSSFFSKRSLSKRLNFLAYRSKSLASAKKSSTLAKSKTTSSPFTRTTLYSCWDWDFPSSSCWLFSTTSKDWSDYISIVMVSGWDWFRGGKYTSFSLLIIPIYSSLCSIGEFCNISKF